MTTMPLTTIAHTESETKAGTDYSIHAPPKDNTQSSSLIPDTGWRGSPPIPSYEGGDFEVDWMSKPPYNWMPECGSGGEELFKTKYESSCWCGAVRFAFASDPLDAKYCHCKQCQRLHGAPFQWAVIFPKTSVRLLKNSNALHCLSTTVKSAIHHVPCKVSCDVCRAPLFDEGKRTVLAYPSSFAFFSIRARLNTIDAKDGEKTDTGEGHHDLQRGDMNTPGLNVGVPLEFQPSCHIFYGQRIMDVCDGM